MQRLKLVIFTSFFILCQGTYALSLDLKEAKLKLKAINQKIEQLETVLTSAHDQEELLHQELKTTEKKISAEIRESNRLQQDLSTREKKVNALQEETKQLAKQLEAQQKLLADHLRAGYYSLHHPPVKSILNPENPATLDRLLTFHHYLMKARADAIGSVKNTKKTLLLNQTKITHEISTLKQLKKQLAYRQEKLDAEITYHKTLIESLKQDIVQTEETLKKTQSNKINLSQMIQSLANQKMGDMTHRFSEMHHHLPKPVKTTDLELEALNQGLTFYAPEGTPVSAVHSGKVVFSDWLKGYGLLIILDHGQGFMTLYAHNQVLFKEKGELAETGEKIATVGHSGGIRDNGLYFEIRQRGKAVPPLEWLS